PSSDMINLKLRKTMKCRFSAERLLKSSKEALAKSSAALKKMCENDTTVEYLAGKRTVVLSVSTACMTPRCTAPISADFRTRHIMLEGNVGEAQMQIVAPVRFLDIVQYRSIPVMVDERRLELFYGLRLRTSVQI
ncbi:hypothetical protein PENTCL1PPCAC_13860, partial [Pristionchus entomophagus]